MDMQHYTPDPRGLLGEPMMLYVRSCHVLGLDANLIFSSVDSNVGTSLSPRSFPSFTVENQHATSAMDDKPSVPNTTLCQYRIATLFPLLETTFSTLRLFQQPNHVHRSRPIPLAFASSATLCSAVF
jgi:hypothetical protein